jgi:hypothetical protein
MVRHARLGVLRAGGAVLLGLLIGACGTYKSQFPADDFDSGFGGFGTSGGAKDAGDATTMSLTRPANAYTGPTSCDQAEMQRSYIGCDYWPTVTTNPVWSIFDFTVVVANAQTSAAEITVTGPNGVSKSVKVAPGALAKIYLPWVTALKGPDCDPCGSVPLFSDSVTAPASAYHLVSSLPVTVYQFNALEYKGAGGPPGKDWSSCPGTAELCVPPDAGGSEGYIGCFSYTNDASLLIPSTAMTGNYRVAGDHADKGYQGSYFAITAVKNATHVTVNVATTATVVGGGDVTPTAAGGTLTLTMDAGDVVEVMSDMLGDATDLSGSLVHADQPVQVIAGTQCSTQPEGKPACDHLESSVLPAETLGSEYVVTVPTSPGGAPVGHVVRFYGNADGTTLTYSPSRPAGCPETLDAGQVVACSIYVTRSFEVKGTHEFAVSSFQLGGSVIESVTHSSTGDGDPSMSPMVATEQYLTSYIFLAPIDYDQSFADIVAPPGTSITLDGRAVTNFSSEINSAWSVTRVALLTGGEGAHVLTASKPVGVQVLGYGRYTSYQYPAGLDLTEISPPPILK